MYLLKGFVTNALLQNNAPGVTATIGEVSSQSLTYSREKGYYTHASAPNQTLISFKSTLAGAPTQIHADLLPLVMAISNFIYNKVLTGTGEMFADQLLLDLTNGFSTSGADFQCGEIKYDGQYYAPEWISWTGRNPASGYNGPDLTDSIFKLWFDDTSFAAQYDEYEIVIVPPVATLDSFFLAGAVVESTVNARGLVETLNAIQAAKNNNPETILRADTYQYIDPLNNTHVVNTQWTTLIYGIAGNNVDLIRAAMSDYILANSTHPKADWEDIIPDIFKTTEYILMPLWQNYAIPNMSLQAGIYSPVVSVTNSLALLKQAVPIYPAAHIDAHAQMLEYPYKSLSMMAIGGPNNRLNLFNLTDVFSDYIAVASTSLDFNRMADLTKNWVLMLEQMLIVAETMTLFSDIPVGMTRVTRDNVLYLVKSYNNIQYLVAAKQSFPLPT